jgi:hypothetical protein
MKKMELELENGFPAPPDLSKVARFLSRGQGSDVITM